MGAGSTEDARVVVRVSVPGGGDARVSTGVPVLDHLLGLAARSAPLDLGVDASAGAEGGEAAVAVGRAIGAELGPLLREPGRRGHGSAVSPAHEALALVALEASGRPLVAANVDLSRAHVGGLQTDLVRRFLDGLAEGAGLTLHVRLLEGDDTHHVVDAIFKALGAALGIACAPPPGR